MLSSVGMRHITLALGPCHMCTCDEGHCALKLQSVILCFSVLHVKGYKNHLKLFWLLNQGSCTNSSKCDCSLANCILILHVWVRLLCGFIWRPQTLSNHVWEYSVLYSFWKTNPERNIMSINKTNSPIKSTIAWFQFLLFYCQDTQVPQYVSWHFHEEKAAPPKPHTFP